MPPLGPQFETLGTSVLERSAATATESPVGEGFSHASRSAWEQAADHPGISQFMRAMRSSPLACYPAPVFLGTDRPPVQNAPHYPGISQRHLFRANRGVLVCEMTGQGAARVYCRANPVPNRGICGCRVSDSSEQSGTHARFLP